MLFRSHSRRDPQPAQAGPTAHDIGVQSDSIQRFHGNNLIALPGESNFSFARHFSEGGRPGLDSGPGEIQDRVAADWDLILQPLTWVIFATGVAGRSF